VSPATQSRVLAILRQVAAAGGIAEGISNTGAIPNNLRVALTVGGALILAVEHAVAGVTGSAGNGTVQVAVSGAGSPPVPVAPVAPKTITVDGKPYSAAS
jgi:hypothetical protein